MTPLHCICAKTFETERQNALDAFKALDTERRGSLGNDRCKDLFSRFGTPYCEEKHAWHMDKLPKKGLVNEDEFVFWYIEWTKSEMVKAVYELNPDAAEVMAKVRDFSPRPTPSRYVTPFAFVCRKERSHLSTGSVLTKRSLIRR